jgi:Ca-activated chloride channel family protein
VRFAEPWAFLALLLVPLSLGVWLWLERRRARQLQAAGDLGLLGRMTGLGPAQGRRARTLEATLVALALGLVALALTRPQFGARTDVRKARGMDVVVALDLSRSMLARDVTPSRLERAKIELEALVDALPGDRVGLIGFTSAALPLCPMTVDHAALVLQLRSAGPEQMPRGGTAIADAIAEAQRMLETSPHKDSGKAIIVVTDGEEHEGDPVAAAQKAQELGIEVHTVGVGSAVGEPIPLPDGSYLRDAAGQTVISRLDTGILEKVAAAGGGVVSVPGASGGLDLSPVRSRLAQLEKADLEARTVRVYEERYRWALTPAFVLLLLATLARARRARLPAQASHAAAALVVVLAPLLSGAGPLEREHPDVAAGNQALLDGKPKEALEAYSKAETQLGKDARVLLNQGLAKAADGELAQAIEAYKAAQAASSDPSLRAQAAYAQGNAERSLKKLDEAIKSYRRSLLDDPQHEGARKNLQLTSAMKRIQALQPKPPGEDKNDKGQNQDQKQGGDSSDGGSSSSGDGGSSPPDGGTGEDGAAGQSAQDDGGSGTADAGSGASPDGSADGPEAGASGAAGQDAEAGGDAAPQSAPSSESDQSDQAKDEEKDRDAVLDALEAKEKALQGKRRAKGIKPRRVEKDW